MRREGALLGALAALGGRDTRQMGRFIDEALRADPEHPDSQALALLDACGRYVTAVRRHAAAGADTVRPPMLWHDTRPVEHLLRTMLRRANHTEPPVEPRPDHDDWR